MPASVCTLGVTCCTRASEKYKTCSHHFHIVHDCHIRNPVSRLWIAFVIPIRPFGFGIRRYSGHTDSVIYASACVDVWRMEAHVVHKKVVAWAQQLQAPVASARPSMSPSVLLCRASGGWTARSWAGAVSGSFPSSLPPAD